MPDQRTQPAILPVLDIAEAIAVLDACSPPAELSCPFANVVIDADILAQYVAAPAVVVARNPQDRRSNIDEISERAKHPKRCARNDRPPLEPELEEIAVDHQRSCSPR